MGISVYATLCYGVVVSGEELDISWFYDIQNNESEFYEDIEEYFYNKFKDLDIHTVGTYEMEKIVLAVKSWESYWDVSKLKPGEVGSFENYQKYREDLDSLLLKLDEMGIPYGEEGLLLFPYYSH